MIVVGTNSYVSMQEAEAYFDARLHADDWEDAMPGDQEKALIWAARMLDSLPWTGLAAEPDQAMAWPRVGMVDSGGRHMPAGAVPPAVKDAQCELALSILKEDPSDGPTGNQRRVKAGSVEIERFQREPDRALPPLAYNAVRAFLAVTDSSVSLRP